MFSSLPIFVISVCLLLISLAAEVVDIDLTVDRSQWKNPNDPLENSQRHNRKSEEEAETAKCDELNSGTCLSKRQSHVENGRDDSTTMKHVIRAVLQRLDISTSSSGSVDRAARVYFTAEQLNYIDKFLEHPNPDATMRERVRYILEEFIEVNPSLDNDMLPRWMALCIQYLPLFNVVLLLPASVLLFKAMSRQRSFRTLFLGIVFLWSFGTTYWRMYQEKFAARMSRFKDTMPSDCLPKGTWEQVADYVLSFVRFRSKTQCLQYYEDRYVDVFWEVSLIDAFAVTLSNCIFTPLGFLGRHLNVFLKEYFEDSPLPVLLMKTVLLVVMVVLLLLFTCGYRLRTWFWTLEPSGHSPLQTAAATIAAVAASNPQPAVEYQHRVTDNRATAAIAPKRIRTDVNCPSIPDRPALSRPRRPRSAEPGSSGRGQLNSNQSDKIKFD